MPKTNSRAITKLIEAQKTLKKLGRTHETSDGQAFTGELIRLMETGKPLVLTVGDEDMPFSSMDVRVSRTRVSFGKYDLVLSHVQRGGEGDGYTIREDSDGDEVVLALRKAD